MVPPGDVDCPGVAWNPIAAGGWLECKQLDKHSGNLSRRVTTPVPPPDQAHPVGEDNILELVVLDMNGSQLTKMVCFSGDSVSDVKCRLSHVLMARPGEQRLVHGVTALRDQDTLAQCGLPRRQVTLQCICIQPSNVARSLEALRHSKDSTKSTESCLADVADSMMRNEYALSESVRPSSEDVTRYMKPQPRAELIDWMLQVFDVFRFDDAMLHSVVLTLDRYYARCRMTMESSEVQRVVLAAVCTEMKVMGEHDFPQGHSRRILKHLSHDHLSIASIQQMELEVLSKLGFVVGVPTPVTFLRELSVHLGELLPAPLCEQALQLALFLLELALFEPDVQYAGPHAILAIGAIGAALCTLDVPVGVHEALLEDLSVYCPELSKAEDLVLSREEELLDLWQASSQGTSEFADFHPHLMAKFGCFARHNVVELSPPARR